MLMECYVAARNVTTLHDLEEMWLAAKVLRLTWTLAWDHPVVRKYFPTVPMVVRITTADVLQSLSIYKNTQDIKVVDEMEFLMYLAEEKSCPEHRGVLLRNVRIYEEEGPRNKRRRLLLHIRSKRGPEHVMLRVSCRGTRNQVYSTGFLDREEAGYGSRKSEWKPFLEPRLSSFCSVGMHGLSHCFPTCRPHEGHVGQCGTFSMNRFKNMVSCPPTI